MPLDYDGVDDEVDCGSPAVLDNIEIKTVTGWFNGDTFATEAHTICGKNSITNGWTIRVGTGSKLRYLNEWTTRAQWDADGALSTGTWYHFAIVYDRGSTANDPVMYINGVLETVTEVSAPTGTVTDDSAQPFQIARRNDASALRWDGKIEDIRIYNRALSAAEIATIYAARGVDGIVQGLVGRWPQDEKEDGGTATVASSVIDISAEKSQGTPAGSPVYRESQIRSRRKVA